MLPNHHKRSGRSSNSHRRRARAVARAPIHDVEWLEARRLLSAGNLIDGVLTVTGTAGADRISVALTGGLLVVTTNGAQQSFVPWQVRRINVSAGDGNDSVSLAPGVPDSVLDGGAGNDSLLGGAAHDTLRGGDGKDDLRGGDGNDVLDGGLQADRISGGRGTDTVDYSARLVAVRVSLDGVWDDGQAGELDDVETDVENVIGTPGNDVLIGNAWNNQFLGLSGNDKLVGGSGNDGLDGGAGNDTLDAGAGNDTVTGGEGRDSITGGEGFDRLDGQSGDDSIWGGLGADTITGGGGTDQLGGDAGNDNLDGGVAGNAVYADNTGNDVIWGGDGDDTLSASDYGNGYLSGGSGNDVLHGWQGRNAMYGDDGNDSIYGHVGNDTISGGAGSDYLSSGAGNGLIMGDDGNDVVYAGDGNDTVYGGAGNDYLSGEGGGDSISGDDGIDTVYGGPGNDTVHGNAGDDWVYGWDGDDKVYGDAGTDHLSGGNGNDTLVSIGGNQNDSLTGEAGYDSFWADSEPTESVIAEPNEVLNGHVHRVSSFMSYTFRTRSPYWVSRELNGQNFPDPLADWGYRNFSNRPLFAPGGPNKDDIDQNALGDCYFLAGLGAVAKVDPDRIRQRIVELGDGTYALQFAGTYIRLDGDLPADGSGRLVYAGLGTGGSLWTALMEKAYAYSRQTDDTKAESNYLAIIGGWVGEAYSAMGAPSTTTLHVDWWYKIRNKPSDLWSWVRVELAAGKAVAVGTPSGSANLVGGHEYVVDRTYVGGDGSQHVVLRNPWGPDNTNGNPYVDLTASQLYNSINNVDSAYV